MHSQAKSGSAQTVGMFDGRPAPTTGRFVKVENDHGDSIKFSDYWVLRIAVATVPGISARCV